MKAYYVKYRLHKFGEVMGIDLLAYNKVNAYDNAVFDRIPARHNGEHPYSAWVVSVTYDNGNEHHFNTHEGMPY